MRKARLFLLLLISILLSSACTSSDDDNFAATETVQAALATEVANQIESLPTATQRATASSTATILQTMTATLTPQPTSTPTLSPTLWYQNHQPQPANDLLQYGLVQELPVVLYTSAEEAASKGERLRTLPGEEVYVSYQEIVEIHGSSYAEILPGGWISLDTVQEFTASQFSGILLEEIPTMGFGWTIEPVVSVSEVPDPETTEQVMDYYERYVVLEVLSVARDVDQQRWFEIQPGEWISDEAFAYVDGAIENPSRGATDRWIFVNLTEQTLVVYQDGQPVFATLVSTGKETGWATGEGLFTVYHKSEANDLLSPDPIVVGNYLIQDVPYILYYQGSFALHGAYWHDNFGFPNSHGCVNLSPVDAGWLYEWANPGEWVILYRD